MAFKKSLPDRKVAYPSDSPVMAAIAEFLCLAGYVRQLNVRWDSAGSIYRLDFAHTKRKLNVEIETPGRRTTTEKDAIRDKRLAAKKWKIIRIPIDEVTIEKLHRECCWWISLDTKVGSVQG